MLIYPLFFWGYLRHGIGRDTWLLNLILLWSTWLIFTGPASIVLMLMVYTPGAFLAFMLAYASLSGWTIFARKGGERVFLTERIRHIESAISLVIYALGSAHSIKILWNWNPYS